MKKITILLLAATITAAGTAVADELEDMMKKNGCNACHALNQEGGKVGPALDRAGFRLNPSWIYRWIKYPQAMKPESRMPNLGISDQDAKAISLYLSTLRAPRQEAAADKPAS